jgi:hypothetical protein
MTNVTIKRVDLYDIGNDQMIVDAIIYNGNSTGVTVYIDIYVPGLYENIILSPYQPVYIDANSYTIFRSNPLEFMPKVIASINIYGEEQSRMISNIVQGEPPAPNMIRMDSIYKDIGGPLIESLAVPVTLQTDNILMFDGAPITFSGTSTPNTKISIFNPTNNKVFLTAQTDTIGKYSVEHQMITGKSSTIIFNVRACNTKPDNTLDLTNVSGLITITVKPVSVVKYAIDATYTGLRNRDSGTISIPTSDFPSYLDALSALKIKAEQIVNDKQGDILRFEYGYEPTNSYHVFHVTWYYVTSKISSVGSSIGNIDNRSLSISNIGSSVPVVYSMIWWVWWLIGALVGLVLLNAIIKVFLGSSLSNLLPSYIKDAIQEFSDVISGVTSAIGTGIVLIAVGYLAMKFGPSLVKSAKKEAPKYIAQAKSEVARLTAG